MDLIKLEIAEGRARDGPNALWEITDQLAQQPDPVEHREAEGECYTCRVSLAKDPEADDAYDDGAEADGEENAGPVSKVSLLFCPNCGKPFHEKCIFGWLDHCIDTEIDETCPNCRGIWLN
jgi:hypothetical protein